LLFFFLIFFCFIFIYFFVSFLFFIDKERGRRLRAAPFVVA